MRLGVIDIGSNTVHLLVVDAYPGAHPLPSSSHKIALRLSEGMSPDGSVSSEQADRLVDFVRECVKLSDDQGVEDLVSFATSAVREAPNGAGGPRPGGAGDRRRARGPVRAGTRPG